jgi:dihydroorotase
MAKILIKGAHVVNEGKIAQLDVLINGNFIEKIAPQISDSSATEINASGLYLFPGLIDDQVHFREPGLTHKANIASESAAAAAGGITSFMEMPNTVPNTLTQELLEEKYAIAAKTSAVNYSFFMGASNDNIEEVLKTNPKNVCGVKVFMGSSTGNMLVDNRATLEQLFSKCPMLIATHCEDEATVKANLEKAKQQYGEDIPIEMHPVIRDEEACYLSSSMAVELAKKHNTRLHILHISTAKETYLFDNSIPLKDKRITAEACIHHLWFSDEDYATKGNFIPLKDKRITAEACIHHLWFSNEDYTAKGNFIKWNPAVKTAADRDEILRAVLDNRIDVIATDHAPHTLEEKQNSYLKAPSGGPLVQHSLVALLDLYHQGKISLERIVEKASHNVATLFRIEKRGFIREGYFADLVLVDLKKPNSVDKSNLLYKCGWSPFEGHTFKSSIHTTFVNGTIVYSNGKVTPNVRGQRLTFNI